MTTGKRDANRNVVWMGVSSVDGTSVPMTMDPTTKRLRVKIAGSEGNNAAPDREKARRDDNRIPVIMGETNDSNRTLTPVSIESANDGMMIQGA